MPAALKKNQVVRARVVIPIAFEPDLHRQLKEMAIAEDEPISVVVRRAVKEAIRRRARETPTVSPGTAAR